MERITRQVVQYISDMEKKAKQMNFVKNLKKEVETARMVHKNMLSKQGENKGKTV